MTALALVAPAFPVRVAGWHINAEGYAEPATAGGGYCDMQDTGTLDVAYEVDQSARDMGMPQFLITKVPAEVLRELLRQYDEARGK